MTTHKTTHHFPYKQTLLLSALSLIGLLIIGIILAYWSNFNDPVTTFIKGRFPAAIVGGKMVSIQKWNDFEAIARKLNPEGDRGAVGTVLIDNLKRQSLLASLRVVMTPKDLMDELEFVKSSEPDQYDSVLNEYFAGDENLFIELVIVPKVYDKLLRLHFNANPNIKHPGQVEAMEILRQIRAGEDFGKFTSLSDDSVSGQLDGDLGFFQDFEILPEVGNKLSGLKLGEVSDEIAISRLGYHVLLLANVAEEDDKKLYNLKHILILSEGFEAWETEQLEKISVRRLK
jgi:hypothetical protein